ncbi:acyl-CoA dehydrogenase family protein [Microbacterium pseudoresistens]|uniref:Alkylation response protein AidB-like acyl-CoA dehydrogenase n=1 Tax=Microbacterium pseudoresistens TaxID=640634 RepID=A0A7Y9JP96_9MICO|nr:acyl-CoA dehydrogenase family protein [Microbacterium pseudoresistens]NYD54444.1 alkylation response protein AidB-like acyl-CoA dehydrogenase [Microbacterium pseudoresistens]
MTAALARSRDDIVAASAARAATTAGAVDGAESEPLHDTLAAYAAIGALGAGVDRDDDDLSDAVAVLSAVAGECMSTAFSLWAHRMVTEYVRASALPARDELLDELVSGRRAGSIAMATALQEAAGLGAVPTLAAPDGEGGYRVSGRIAWASNIAEGTLVVFPARVVAEGAEASADDGARVILVTTVGEDGLTTRPVEDLLALGATRSAMLAFDGLHVPAGNVLAESLAAVAAQRTTHFLLQTALCLGLARRSLAEAGERLGGPNQVLGGFQTRLSAQAEALTADLDRFARSADAVSPREVTLLRFESARLANAAARHESALTGGRGFVTTSATNRRLREASFLPVQSPSEVQLLWELEQFGDRLADAYTI